MSLKFGKLYDKKQIDFQGMLYPTKAMIALLVPIVIEQLLNSFMGMVDTMMVSNVGSEAISAVSLVDSINNLVIQVFSAMATGAEKASLPSNIPTRQEKLLPCIQGPDSLP